MRKMQRTFFGLILIALAVSPILIFAQPASPEDPAKVVAREFGDSFKLLTQFAPITLDMDGDGKDDLVVVVTAPNPLLGEREHNYHVSDPYSASLGYPDSKALLMYPAEATPQYLAIIHDWRAQKPKAKFLLVNIPFAKLESGGVQLKKKTHMAIQTEEMTGIRGATFWDGRKYRWMPTGENIPEFEQLEVSKPAK
jgi:hypothetical protein